MPGKGRTLIVKLCVDNGQPFKGIQIVLQLNSLGALTEFGTKMSMRDQYL